MNIYKLVTRSGEKFPYFYILYIASATGKTIVDSFTALQCLRQKQQLHFKVLKVYSKDL